MHLLLLGLVLVVGILVYYIMTTTPSGKDIKPRKKKVKPQERSKASENLRKEDNVIFLPRADGTDGAAGSSESVTQADDTSSDDDPDSEG